MTRNTVVVVVTILEDTELQRIGLIILYEGSSYHIDDRQEKNRHKHHKHREDNAEGLHHCVRFHSVKVDQTEHNNRLVLLKYEPQREAPEEFVVYPH
jgi:hypothetical protein